MPAAVIAAGLGLLAALAVAAVRLPAPHVSEAAWQCAKVAVIPVSLLWMVSMTVVARPTAFAFAMVSGMGCCAVAWVMRPPPEAVRRRDDRRPDGGDDDDGSAPGGGPGGLGAVDWDAFERAAFDAWRAAAAAEARRRR
jgi:hypothetical protein